MHHTRHAMRPGASHCGGRLARCGPPARFGRGMAHWSPFAQHFGRFPPEFGRFPPHSEFAPLFRLFDESAFQNIDNLFPGFMNGSRARSFEPVYQPRFDIREVDNSYELRGELPGVRNEELSVEFTDPQTLVIKGRTVREAESGAPAATSEVNAATAPDDASETASIISASSYQRPSVEDAEPEKAESSAAGATPTTSVVANEQPPQPATTENQTTNNERYWMSERSVGEFQRTFTFPAPVDQDGVTASLKDGILSMTVPKAAAPSARRINVE